MRPDCELVEPKIPFCSFVFASLRFVSDFEYCAGLFGRCHRLLAFDLARIAGPPGKFADFLVPGGKRLGHPERTERLDLGGHFVDDGLDPLALGGGNPLEPHPLFGNPEVP